MTPPTNSPTRILVTGASGRIGSAVAARLAADGHDLVLMDRRRPDGAPPDPPPPDAPFVACDSRDRDRVEAAMAGVDVVCHLGEIPNVGNGLSDAEVFDANTAGCRTMLAAAIERGVGRFIYTSSCQQYGYWSDNQFPVDQTPARWPLDELLPAAPRNAYAHSKAVNEIACREAAARHAIDVMIYRFPWVIAPRVAPRLRERWRRSDERMAEGFWSYLDLRDAVEAYALGVRADRPLVPLRMRCEAFHFIADDVLGPMSTREKLARHVPHFDPLPADWPDRRPPVSCAKAERFLGWRARHRIEATAAEVPEAAAAGR